MSDPRSIRLSLLLSALLSVMLVAAPASAQIEPFTEEAVARGLDYTMDGWPQSHGFYGNGVGFADLDSDGDPDVIVMGSLPGQIGVFENVGGGSFVDRSMTTGFPLMPEQQGFAAADYDADGLIDIYFTQQPGINYLMRNMGGFIFSNVNATALVGDDGPSFGPTWADYDGDGWLDLYVSNYSAFPPGNVNVLYRNKGDGSFEDVAPALGLDSDALSFQSVWSDYDRDGDVDLYVSNDRAPLGFPRNQFFRNDGGTFVDVSEDSGADVGIYSMGLAAGDFDGNGYPDYYVTNVNTVDPPYDGINPLLLNQGDGTFVESAELAGVDNRITSWGAIFFDFDNNGAKDLYVNNMFAPNAFFISSGGFPCVEVAASAAVEAAYDSTPPLSIASFSSAVADVDDDGDLDLVLNNFGAKAELFVNNEGTERNWIRYDIVGEHPNLNAIGGSVETTAGSRVAWDEIYAGGNGYLGQNELTVHVGLDDETLVDQAAFRWPGGAPTRTLTNLPVNERWSIYPPSRLCDSDGNGVDNDDFVVFAGCFHAGFAPGCEMMDFGGDSLIYVDDLDDCFVDVPADCNANGTEDRIEILFDLSLDGDADGAIDCCAGASTPFPNAVGATLLVDRDRSGVQLSWDAPSTDAAHDAADSYDILRSTSDPDGVYGLLANVSTESHTDPPNAHDRTFYLVVSRNMCGSSGEEPY